MPLSWKRKPKPETPQTKKKRREQIDRVAWTLYESRFSHNKEIDKDNIWTTAKKIAKSPVRRALFTCNRPFIKLEKLIWEPILTWADNQALLSLLGVIGNVGLIIAVSMYIGSEKQRRDTEELTAWQTLTNAHGQPGNGGRIHALEFLNASPRNREYDYPGANWRRRAICLWICTWPSESLAGVDLSIDTVEKMESVYLSGIQLPDANLLSANLEGATMWSSNLKGASLVSANLNSTDLRSANLEDAVLRATNFKGANLRYANLKGADLLSANLEGAFLQDTDLDNTKSLTQEQISQAKLCRTQLPSNISLDPNRDCQELDINPYTGEKD